MTINYTNDTEQIIRLWQEAFGDSREDIIFFVNNAKNTKCLACFDGEIMMSMMFLVQCSIKGKNGLYVYAACTDKRFRGQGCMSALLKYAKDYTDGFVCLIPADKALIDYYYPRGYTKSADTKDLQFEQCDEIKEYLFEGCTLDEPFVMIN